MAKHTEVRKLILANTIETIEDTTLDRWYDFLERLSVAERVAVESDVSMAITGYVNHVITNVAEGTWSQLELRQKAIRAVRELSESTPPPPKGPSGPKAAA